MGGARKSPWVIGTVLLAFVLLAGAWFLLIAPSLDEAASNRAQTKNEQDRIDTLEIQLASLEADFARIEEFRGTLSELRNQVPTAVEVSALTRQIESLATTAGVAVLNVSPTSPTLVTVVDPVAAEQAANAAATADAEADAAVGDLDAATGDAAATPAPPATSYYAVPVNLTTFGDYANTLDFIEALQTQNSRLVLVSDLQATRVGATGSTGGRPAVADGALEARISAYALVVPTTDPGASDPDDGQSVDEPLPVPAGEPNPFVPFVPTA